MSNKIKKINFIQERIKELSNKIIEKDKTIFNNLINNLEDVITFKKKGKRGRPKKDKKI